MTQQPNSTYGWAIQWRSHNSLDGSQCYLMGKYIDTTLQVPAVLGGYSIAVFQTRREARAFVKAKYSYIRTRPDPHAEPHGWKMPRVVKVRVSIKVQP